MSGNLRRRLDALEQRARLAPAYLGPAPTSDDERARRLGELEARVRKRLAAEGVKLTRASGPPLSPEDVERVQRLRELEERLRQRATCGSKTA